MTHYHVLSGQHGCMPDRNEAYPTLKEAKQDMAWWMKEIEDSLEEQPRDKKGQFAAVFSGGTQHHYAECLFPHECGLEYIEITPCNYPDCLLDKEK